LDQRLPRSFHSYLARRGRVEPQTVVERL
jgi:hypothetical protein